MAIGAALSAQSKIFGIGSAVIIDFTRPEATMIHIEIAIASGTAMWWQPGCAEQKELESTRQIPIVYCKHICWRHPAWPNCGTDGPPAGCGLGY